MKTSCLTGMVTVLLLFTLGCTSKQNEPLTQQQKEQIKSELKSIMDDYATKWVNLDADGILPYYSPELVVVFDTLLLDHDAYMKGWSDYAKTSEKIKLNPIYTDVRVLTKDFAIVTWCGNVERLMKSGDLIIAKPGIWTDVWKRVDGKWKSIYEHGAGNYTIQAAEKK